MLETNIWIKENSQGNRLQLKKNMEIHDYKNNLDWVFGAAVKMLLGGD